MLDSNLQRLYLRNTNTIYMLLVKRLPLILTLLIALATFSYGQIPNSLSLNEKLYGLSKFWSECNYNFVYMYKVDKEQWDDAYKAALQQVVDTKNDYEYYRELQKLCALLKDGHTQVYLPEAIEEQIMISHFGAYRLFLTNSQQRIYVGNVNKSKETEIPVGSELLKVNGLSTQDYRAKYVSPYISSSTQQGLENKAAYNLLSGFAGDEFEIQFKTPKGELRTLKLQHAKSEEQELAVPVSQRGNFEFKWLKDQIAYIAIRTFDDAAVVDSFESKLKELKLARAIVLDVRDNGGGSSRNALNIAKYFVEGDTIFGARSYSREIIPTDRAIGSFLTAQDTIEGKAQWGLNKLETTDLFKAYSGNKFYAYPYQPAVIKSPFTFSVPAAILTNSYTASAAEDFLIYLDNQKNMQRVGQYTNGSTGQPLQIALPGNTTAWICTKKVTKANGDEFVGTGIKPAIIVTPDLNTILYPTKYDSTLQQALQQLGQ